MKTGKRDLILRIVAVALMLAGAVVLVAFGGDAVGFGLVAIGAALVAILKTEKRRDRS